MAGATTHVDGEPREEAVFPVEPWCVRQRGLDLRAGTLTRSADWQSPAGTTAFHINADIAAAVTHYLSATGDQTLEVEAGLELLVETARLWVSMGHHDVDGAWHIAGVTGPDEYTAVVNDNLFTNLAAAHNLRMLPRPPQPPGREPTSRGVPSSSEAAASGRRHPPAGRNGYPFMPSG